MLFSALKPVLIGALLGVSALGFSACNDSSKKRTQALDAGPKAADKSAATEAQKLSAKKVSEACKGIKALQAKTGESPEKIKILEDQIDKELAVANAKMIMVSEQLLDEAHSVFMEVWQKLEPRMDSVSTSAFKEARQQILASYSAETGKALEKPTEYRNRTDGLRVKPMILRDENCRPRTLELQLVDAQSVRKEVYAAMTYRKGGEFKLLFRAASMPEGLGQRLGALSKEVTCEGKYKKNRHLSYLKCEHLGQEGHEAGRSEKILVEFSTFLFDLDAAKDVVVAKEHRYLDLVNPDTQTPEKDIRVSVDLQKIHIREFKAPPSGDTDNVLGFSAPAEEKVPAKTPPAEVPAAVQAESPAPAAETEYSAYTSGRGDEPAPAVTTPVN